MRLEGLEDTKDTVDEDELLAAWARQLPRSPSQLNRFNESDAELLPLGTGRVLAATIDTIDEEIRWGIYREPYTGGRVAALATLSDLAAVGAEPLGLLLSVGLPQERRAEVQRGVAGGVAEVCRSCSIAVFGGDTNDAATLSISCVGLGLLPEGAQQTRKGAKPGDRIFVSGPLGDGGALAAVRVLGAPELYSEADFRPPVRIRHGKALRGVASACMDTSDGFLVTLDHLARINRVGMRIDSRPRDLLSRRGAAVAEELALPPLALLAAVHGEFELVFTVPEHRLGALHRVSAATNWRPIQAGIVVPSPGVFLRERTIDVARLRRLASRTGTPREYAREVVAACAAMESGLEPSSPAFGRSLCRARPGGSTVPHPPEV